MPGPASHFSRKQYFGGGLLNYLTYRDWFSHIYPIKFMKINMDSLI